ncbi:MAG: dynamin family protein [Chthoniobacterales bacterium]
MSANFALRKLGMGRTTSAPYDPRLQTMQPDILSPELKTQFEALRILLQRALWLVEKCADVEGTQILRARLANVQSAALLVIVGEVKAGKSSFLNALVGEEVCRAAPEPCTVQIQELVYGPERSVVALGNQWERRYLPKEVLRELSLVDTPGTNSILHDHQTITENYIPQSDLVVFVVSATNPHTATAWELLTLIRKEWHRKMVFVLQQADRASARELTTNRAHVEQYARERGVKNPTVFTLSAKLEMEGEPNSGFAEFREFLRYGIECGEVWRTKVEGSYQTIRTVMAKLLTHLREEKSAIAEERAFYKGLVANVEARQKKADSLKSSIVGQLAATYDQVARESEDQFADNLRFGEIFRRAIPFAGNKENDNWVGELKARFHNSRVELAREAPRIAQSLLAEMQALTEEMRLHINRREERIRESVILPETAGRLEMLEQLKAKLASLRVVEINQIVHDTVGEAADIRKLTIAGSGLVVIGALVLMLSLHSWVALLGGAFLGLGVLLLVSGLFWRRTGLLRDFRQKLGASRKEFRQRIESHIAQIFDGLFYEVHQALTESIFRLDVQESFVEPLLEETFQVGEGAADMILRVQRSPAPRPVSG